MSEDGREEGVGGRKGGMVVTGVHSFCYSYSMPYLFLTVYSHETQTVCVPQRQASRLKTTSIYCPLKSKFSAKRHLAAPLAITRAHALVRFVHKSHPNRRQQEQTYDFLPRS